MDLKSKIILIYGPTASGKSNFAVKLSKKQIPGSRNVIFGHIGDGNIHFNISQPIKSNKAEFLGKEKDLRAVSYTHLTLPTSDLV